MYSCNYWSVCFDRGFCFSSVSNMLLTRESVFSSRPTYYSSCNNKKSAGPLFRLTPSRHGGSHPCFPLLVRISTLTIFFSGLVALFEYDLKKIIALSTLSQLGVMIFSISLGLPYIAFFHLLTHALFKALLFLCAGACIHQVGGPQDLRFFGILVKNSPLIISSINLANLSLCGIPFLSGFYSKDLIVEYAAQGS